ncbi:Tetratricopeptide repeat protein [Novipirellula aureliae]|uniref:Tetratricopeptide repeat protein n=1 Tax=Novipirellula aureliae TaxID=2527966 RepID=A0A5C6DT62_9BACT|nr:BatD family protein [Novipirellula aureliae]TWU39948.1 Tetratricopeptide repeat protein [Novipirellula aureliae]
MKQLITTIAFTALLVTAASAANIETRLSTRETYVGSPIVLQLSITDAGDYDQPAPPVIEGCEVRSNGAPSQSTRIAFINGRRSESRSVTLQYLITPRREGTFTIPAMTFEVDGKTVATEPQRFVATKSETGDLMFVEIEGGKDKVFVGEPLDLTLKVWIKPFRDPETGQTLSEGSMWNRISDSTSWGGFANRMKEMYENNQRPGGQEVLRDDGRGNERAYYQYEINATVYPKRAGKIDADDVQIVVNYPTALGRSRSPLARFFDDDMFGGSSPFGSRMVVTSSRPIVGDVRVDATEVLPVPTAGRPADYRGAVGRYQIATQASPTTVDAGDPITLNIGIAGTGPMELVQAPPLDELSELTADFKVADEPLAGFVRADTKLFSTTIRPRREGIKQIPAIRFSFFDPETESFQTVKSEPIKITVSKSESLALDAIVGHGRRDDSDSATEAVDRSLPDLTNHSDASVLVSQSPRGPSNWWWAFVIVPPIVWLATAAAKYRDALIHWLPSLKSPKSRCLAAIERAKDQEAMNEAVVDFVLARNRTRQSLVHPRSKTPGGLTSESNPSATRRVSRSVEAVGSLRVAGMYQVANEVESFLAKSATEQVQILANSAAELVERIDAEIRANRKTRVKTMKQKDRAINLTRPLALLFVALTVSAFGTKPAVAEGVKTLDSTATVVQLSPTQQQTLLSEATDAYTNGITKSHADAASAKELLETATEKYQLLVDSGIQNADLFINLGNAYLQTGRLGYAIANYERALQLDPGNPQAIKNVAYADKKTGSQRRQDIGREMGNIPTLASSVLRVRSWNNAFTSFVGARPVTWLLALSSITFWGLLILRIVFRPFPLWKYAAVPLMLLLLSLGSVSLTQTNPQPTWNAVIVADDVSLRAGDGDQFDSVLSAASSQGQRVEMLATRGDWTQIRTDDGHVGWVHVGDLEVVKSQKT